MVIFDKCKVCRKKHRKNNNRYFLDWFALHLKVGSGIDQLFLEIIRSYLDKFNVFFYYSDNLKVPTIVSINFVS